MAEEVKYEIDNTYVHYVKYGQGPKNFVTISGVSLRGFEGMGSAIAKEYAIFENEYTCYCFDRRKFLEDDADTEILADDVYRILKEDGVDSADFFGVSQGGMIAQLLALKHPEMVEKLILGSTSAYASPMMEDVIKEWGSYIEKGDVAGFNVSFYQHVYSHEFFGKNERALRRLARIGTQEELHRMGVLGRCIHDFDTRKRLKDIKCPCLVIGSGKDEVFGYDAAKELAGFIGCELLTFEEGSHAAYDEVPEYLPKVKEFFDKK